MIEITRAKGGAKPLGPCACDTYCTECSGRPTCQTCTETCGDCTNQCTGGCSLPSQATYGHSNAQQAVSIYKHLEKRLALALAEVKKQKGIWQGKATKKRR
jgi:hypothetical protein